MKEAEARARAAQIWPRRRIDRLSLRPDGGADVVFAPAAPRRGEVAVPALHWSYHRLDAEGRVACHDSCAAWEAASS